MKSLIHRVLIYFIFSFSISIIAKGQVGEGKIFGVVRTVTGMPIYSASVVIKELNKGVTTDTSGYYSLTNIPFGTYTLVVSAFSYKSTSKSISINAIEAQRFNFKLEEESLELEEVTIESKSKVQEVKEQPFAVTSIDATKLHNTTSDVNQVLNKTTGVRIREDGGLGSNFSFSLNGFTGNQVKFFIDGVPMDNFGPSLSLNNIPINMADRIEVYKGVVPIELGTDALGGAVNVVTNQKIKKYADVSYSYGSFNTHRASLNSKYTFDSSGIILSTNAYYNYSDNSYKVDVQIPKPGTKTLGEYTEVKRFHDGYQSGAMQLEAGVVDKKYADKLFIGFTASANRKDIQQGMTMNDVAGKVFRKSQTVMPSIRYLKNDFLIKGLSVNLYSSYNKTNSQIVDTFNRRYDWSENYVVNYLSPYKGEISDYKTLFKFTDETWLGIANLVYKFNNDRHSISLNNTYSNNSRVGTDEIAIYPIPFSEPNIIRKNIVGFAYGYTSLNKRWKANIFTKWFNYSSVTYDGSYGEHNGYTTSYSRNGVGAATSYFLTKKFQIKASVENTYRLPNADEVFGDGLLTLVNAQLLPEKSLNINTGFNYYGKYKKHKYEIESNLLFRNSDNYIRYASTGMTGRYNNLASVRTTGVEFAVSYLFNELLFANVNATYQKAINTMEFEPKGSKMKSYIYLDQVPNIPFLFGNADLGITFKKVGHPSRKLSLSWGISYVEGFYLFWPSQGGKGAGDKKEIPTQFTQRAGITYSMANGKYNISIDGNNILNAKVYDNFNIQKPGRSIFIKLRYFFN